MQSTSRNKAVALIRVSSDKQALEGASLDAQREAVGHYCLLRGLDLVATLESPDGVSAKKPLAKRPNGPELISLVERGEVAHVIATRLDRLFRNALDAKKHIADWTRRGVALHLLQFGGDGPVDTASTLGKFFLGMLCEMAEFESNMTGDRVRETKDHLKRNLQAYSTPPFGYRFSPGRRLPNGRIVERSLLPVPAEQKVVARIFRLYARTKSFNAVAARLNSENVPTKRGRKWYAVTVSKICRNSIHGGVS